MSVRVDVSEVLAHAAAAEASVGAMRAGLMGVMQETVDQTVKAAKPKFRVDTGASRDSMSGEVSGGGDVVEGEAGPTTSYWPYNEFGTSKMSAAPAVIPAQIETQGFFEERASAMIDSVLP